MRVFAFSAAVSSADIHAHQPRHRHDQRRAHGRGNIPPAGHRDRQLVPCGVVFAIHTPWPPIAGSEAQLPDGTVGVPYPGVTFSATGGDGGSYSWLQDVGNQPPGLSISSSGVFSGTPTAAGTFIVSVSIYDTSGDEGTVAANW